MFKPISKELLKKAFAGDKEALTEICETAKVMIYRLAAKHRYHWRMELHDLRQVGFVTLVETVQWQDLSKSKDPTGYLRNAITNQMVLANKRNLVMWVSDEAQEALAKARRKALKTEQQNGKYNLLEAIRSLKLPAHLVMQAQSALSVRSYEHLREYGFDPAMSQSKDGQYSNNGYLAAMIEDLPGRECQVLKLRYGFGGEAPKGCNEVARILGVTSPTVLRYEQLGLMTIGRKLGYRGKVTRLRLPSPDRHVPTETAHALDYLISLLRIEFADRPSPQELVEAHELGRLPLDLNHSLNMDEILDRAFGPLSRFR